MSNNMNEETNEDLGHVYRGVNAELSVVRAAASNPEASRMAIQQYMDPAKEEVLLHDALAVKLSVFTVDQGEEGEREESSLTNLCFSDERGTLVVTSERLMFWSQDASQVAKDFAIDATCIELHALQEEPEMAVYIQAQDNDADEDAAPLELTVVPTAGNTLADSSHACQGLFDALCKLISLHPIDPNENDDNAMGMMMMGMGGSSNDGDDMMVYAAAPTQEDSQFEDADEDAHEATLEERERMLQRLDDILVVPPELEKHSDHEEGQFSDAEEDIL